MSIKSAMLNKTLISAAVACCLSFGTTAQPLRPAADNAAKVEDYQPDPKKRLTVARFVKGVNRLHGYLKNAVEKAEGEDKKFLSKEKAEIERQLKAPEAALKAQFDSIDAQIDRLNKLKIFPAPLVAKMRMHYLETEAGKVVGVLIGEKRKPQTDARTHGEIQYQLGIIAHRDQVNYKTALRHFTNAVSHVPNNVEYLTTLADLHMTLENKKDAGKLYKDALVNLKKQSGEKSALEHLKQKLAMSGQ